jgi:hypothetical protein
LASISKLERQIGIGDTFVSVRSKPNASIEVDVGVITASPLRDFQGHIEQPPLLLSLKPSQIFVRPATTILTKATKQRSIRFRRNRVLTVTLAIEALATIENDEALDQIEKAITFGLPPDNPASYEESDDKFAPIRYHAVLGLKHCKSAALACGSGRVVVIHYQDKQMNDETMKRQRTASILLLVYLFATGGALTLLFLSWDRGPMSEMANGIKIVFSFGCVCVATVALFVAFFFVKGSIRVYAMAAAMLCIWGLVAVYNLGSDIRWAFTPRGHYYSLEYRNHSNQNVFVDGLGDLRASKDIGSGIRVVYRLPRQIVWWNGSDWRKVRPSDKSFLVVPPEGIKYGDHIVFTLNDTGVWETSVE